MADLHESKSTLRVRNVLSFLLFALITLSSLSLCTRLCFLNEKEISNQFISYNYVSSLQKNITQYAEDVFIKNGIPYDDFEDVITYEQTQELVRVYTLCRLTSNSGYTDETVSTAVEAIQKSFGDEIKKQLEYTDYKYNEQKADLIVGDFGDYINAQVTVGGIDKIHTAVNIGSAVSSVFSALFVIASIILCAIMFFEGKKRYRSVRAISISFMSSGFFELCLCLIVIIISHIKRVDIFPLYLREAFMNYVNTSLEAVAASAVILLLLSLVFSALSWKLKHNKK